MNYKDILIRAGKTFIQAFIPVVISAFAAADLTDFPAIKNIAISALLSGAAAGISAVWNIILGLIPDTAKDEDIYVETDMIGDTEENPETADEVD